jgi:hypothetical protein
MSRPKTELNHVRLEDAEKWGWPTAALLARLREIASRTGSTKVSYSFADIEKDLFIKSGTIKAIKNTLKKAGKLEFERGSNTGGYWILADSVSLNLTDTVSQKTPDTVSQNLPDRASDSQNLTDKAPDSQNLTDRDNSETLDLYKDTRAVPTSEEFTKVNSSSDNTKKQLNQENSEFALQSENAVPATLPQKGEKKQLIISKNSQHNKEVKQQAMDDHRESFQPIWKKYLELYAELGKAVGGKNHLRHGKNQTQADSLLAYGLLMNSTSAIDKGISQDMVMNAMQVWMVDQISRAKDWKANNQFMTSREVSEGYYNRIFRTFLSPRKEPNNPEKLDGILGGIENILEFCQNREMAEESAANIKQHQQTQDFLAVEKLKDDFLADYSRIGKDIYADKWMNKLGDRWAKFQNDHKALTGQFEDPELDLPVEADGSMMIWTEDRIHRFFLNHPEMARSNGDLTQVGLQLRQMMITWNNSAKSNRGFWKNKTITGSTKASPAGFLN